MCRVYDVMRLAYVQQNITIHTYRHKMGGGTG